LGLQTAEAYSFSFRNSFSLKSFCLKVSGTIDEQILTEFLDKMPNIEQISLKGRLSHFSLDNFYNLKNLSLNGTINDDFNFELFKNICYQLERLSFSLIKDYEIIENFWLVIVFQIWNIYPYAIVISDE
jgi:hypothetical protein